MSKEVKRYNFDVDKFGSPRAYESEHGRWMKRADCDALLAERDAQKKDWQSECLKKGFEYVREPDDHYVVADPSEMASLLRDLLGVDVRAKDGEDYGVSVIELQEQIEGLINTLHDQQSRLDAMKAALKFYAEGEHFVLSNEDAWDTVSGEPLNFLHHDDGFGESEGFVEDGSIARAALQGEQP